MIAAMISASAGGKAKLEDFMLKFEKEASKAQTPEQMMFVLQCFTKAFNSGQA